MTIRANRGREAAPHRHGPEGFAAAPKRAEGKTSRRPGSQHRCNDAVRLFTGETRVGQC